jgi:GT2 family glycosyltransferase
MMQEIAAIIVAYHNHLDVLICAQQLISAGLPAERIFVVDHSEDSSLSSWLVPRLAGPWVIANPDNPGFAAGCNRGSQAAFDRYPSLEALLWINPDTRFESNLLNVLAPSGDDLSRELRSPEVFHEPHDGDAPAELWFGGAWRTWLPGRLRYRRAGANEVSVDYLWACCILVGKGVWQGLGPLDEGFFMYYEDMEYCDRARAAGMTLTIAPGTKVIHAVGGSFKHAEDPERVMCIHRSGVRYHASLGSLALVIRLALEARALCRAGLRRESSQFLALARGIRHGLGDLWSENRIDAKGSRSPKVTASRR